MDLFMEGVGRLGNHENKAFWVCNGEERRKPPSKSVPKLCIALPFSLELRTRKHRRRMESIQSKGKNKTNNTRRHEYKIMNAYFPAV